MKTISPATSLTWAATLAAACLLHASSLFARDAQEKLERQFPHVIQYELGASGFNNGDQITIMAVRGDREHIEPGGSYLVEGTYTLASANSADLALFCTTSSRSGPTPVMDSQHIKITKGSGKFHLYEKVSEDGWLHVSFYPDNSSWHGGVYFGETGRENTINRHQEWFSNPPVPSAHKQHDSGNSALIAYLGNPVPPPADMDARYTKQGLTDALQLAARNAGITLKKIAIEDSEFPFLIGVVCAGPDFSKLKTEINKMDGYKYGGGVGDDTCFAGCIVPSNTYPGEYAQQIHHRRTLREEVFYDKFCAEQ